MLHEMEQVYVAILDYDLSIETDTYKTYVAQLCKAFGFNSVHLPLQPSPPAPLQDVTVHMPIAEEVLYTRPSLP